MAAGDDALRVLHEINNKLAAILTHLAAKDSPAKAAPANPWNGPPAQAQAPRPYVEPPRVAPASDLDSQYGDPEVRSKSPRDWTGEAMMGRKFSECPAEYLDLVAERLDYFAIQNDSSMEPDAAKKARYNRLDAARARGWAARIRAGYTPAPPPPMDGADDIPF